MSLCMLIAHLKVAPFETSVGITFPPSTAQKRVLANGLTLIVQEDRSAPVVSVQAWCGTGSVDENDLGSRVVAHSRAHALQGNESARIGNWPCPVPVLR